MHMPVQSQSSSGAMQGEMADCFSLETEVFAPAIRVVAWI
jgi:hypothetical protein